MKKHTIKKYLDALYDAQILVRTNISDNSIFIDNLTFNSKEVVSGTLFICKGSTFKRDYLSEAINLGAKFYISEFDYKLNIPHIIVKDIRKAMSIVANIFFENPSKDLKMVGITGTKGKSTTLYFLKSILDTYFKSLKKPLSGYTSSVDYYDGIETKESKNTTPESVELQKILRTAVDSGTRYFEMEVSSQALKYDRVSGLNYDYGIFMNISEDHISPIEHKDFDDYFNSKLKLFDISQNAIININSDYIDEILRRAKKCDKIITFGMSKEADIYAYNIEKTEANGIKFRIKTKEIDEDFEIGMPGIFNVENALAAIATALEFDIPAEYIRKGLIIARCPGRMEVYSSDDGQIISIVDYAHNKLSFARIFDSVKMDYPDRRIVVIFGSAGGKAIGRRKDLGIVAGEMADKIYLTSDDPAEEDPREIANDIYRYASKYDKPIEIIIERKDAIIKALDDHKVKSIYLILGKGDERQSKIGKSYVDYPSDVEIVKEYIKFYNENHQ